MIDKFPSHLSKTTRACIANLLVLISGSVVMILGMRLAADTFFVITLLFGLICIVINLLLAVIVFISCFVEPEKISEWSLCIYLLSFPLLLAYLISIFPTS